MLLQDNPAVHSELAQSALSHLYILETVRRHYLDEYLGIVTETLPASDGMIPVPQGPGLGVELTAETLARPDMTIEHCAGSA